MSLTLFAVCVCVGGGGEGVQKVFIMIDWVLMSHHNENKLRVGTMSDHEQMMRNERLPTESLKFQLLSLPHVPWDEECRVDSTFYL